MDRLIAAFAYPVCIFNDSVILPLLPQLTKEYLLGVDGIGMMAMMAMMIIRTMLATFILCVLLELIWRLLFTWIERWLYPGMKHLGQLLGK